MYVVKMVSRLCRFILLLLLLRTVCGPRSQWTSHTTACNKTRDDADWSVRTRSPREFNIVMTRVEENCNDLFQCLRLELLDN